MSRPAPRRIYTPCYYSPRLTDNEMLVLWYMVQGWQFLRIAQELGKKRDAVKATAAKLYQKLGADNRVHAVVLALDRNLFDQWILNPS